MDRPFGWNVPNIAARDALVATLARQSGARLIDGTTVATVLSRNAASKYTEPLIALVKDTDRDIAAQAAPGLGKIGGLRRASRPGQRVRPCRHRLAVVA